MASASTHPYSHRWFCASIQSRGCDCGRRPGFGQEAIVNVSREMTAGNIAVQDPAYLRFRLPAGGRARWTYRTIVRYVFARFINIAQLHKLPLSEVAARGLWIDQAHPIESSTLEAPAGSCEGLTPAADITAASGHECTYCGQVYAPDGALAIAVVIDHLNGNCPGLMARRVRRRFLAPVSELERRAMDGDR